MPHKPPSKRGVLFFPAATCTHGVGWEPPADVYRTRDGWLAKFDLAGINPEEIRVQVSGRCLSVAGVRRDWLLEEGCHYHSLEIAYSRFERQLEFPQAIEHAQLTMEYQAGMLLVRIQMKEERP